MLFDISAGAPKAIENSGFSDEKELQTFVENNMEALLNIKFLATEFIIDESNRVDSVGYDSESNSFVLIEDKNLIDKGLVDQGFTYLAALLDRKEKFVLLYNSETGEARSCKDFDWSQTRVVFISPEFNYRQIQSTSFNDMAFELWELKKYGHIISFNKLENKKKTSSVKTFNMSERSKGVLDVITAYTDDVIFTKKDALYEKYVGLRDLITELPGVCIIISKTGIKFKVNNQRFAEVTNAHRKDFDICLNNERKELKDPYGMSKDITSNAWGKLTWLVKVSPDTDLDSVMYLVKQAYTEVKKVSD
ncbi:MAG: hypothetical protein RBR05_06025 [Candidatus Methanomethylophilaceae archaeon]|jgi:predicted transport protein|nr:hypothetical protein [Candidatus Methanomethylophilaceae archaeon]MDY0224930.1 hypothetical protein [Candidatus Methanomethylophilaceae archaeon]